MTSDVKHKTSRNRQREAECAAEHYLRVEFGCVNTVRAVKSRFHRQDLFACDVIGKRRCGSLVGMQVTCGDHRNVGHRRRKLEKVSWSTSDRVLLGEFRSEKVGARMLYWFRVHSYQNGEWFIWSEKAEVPRTWFRAFRQVE